MINETYVNLVKDGIEYGFSFHESAESEDVLFDLRLGWVPYGVPGSEETISAAFEANQKYADAVCKV